jgi:hypothetical protein
MTPPSCQAVDVIKSGGTAGPRPAAGGCCAFIELLKTPDNSNTTIKSAHLIFASFLVIIFLRLQGRDFNTLATAGGILAWLTAWSPFANRERQISLSWIVVPAYGSVVSDRLDLDGGPIHRPLCLG